MSKVLFSFVGLALTSTVALLWAKLSSAELGKPLPECELDSRMLDKAREVARSPDAFRMRQRYADLFRIAGAEGLKELKSHSSDGIAIQAAWQEVVLTIPDKELHPALHVDRSNLTRFLGFLKDRAGVHVPQWWEKLLLEAHAYGPENIWFPLPLKNLYHESGLGLTEAPNDTTLQRENGRVVLRIGNRSATLPDGLMNEDKDCVSALITPRQYYIAVHDHWGYPYPLVCIERENGRIIWRTEVWAHWWGSIRGGIGTEWVTVTQQGDQIVVFGAGDLGAHVEAFNTKDGSNVFRFSTSY